MLINIIRGYTNIKYLGVETFVKQINIKYICIKKYKNTIHAQITLI